MRTLLAPFRLVGTGFGLLFRAITGHPWTTVFAGAGVITALIVVGLATTFEGLPVTSIQRGFRGVGMLVQYNARTLRPEIAANRLETPFPAVPPAGRTAEVAYKNIQVLKDVDANEFLRLMAQMAQWVAPRPGCAYCHSVVNMADDKVYQKTIARHMIEMVRDINTNWQSHVGTTGVTCGTCHRGNGIPAVTWQLGGEQAGAPHGWAESDTGMNLPSQAAGETALPSDPFTPFLFNAAPIRVQSDTALPAGDLASVKQADWTYALMIHFAQSLGVSCNFCHNTRAFSVWDQGTPQRVTAWHGIEMVRNLNRTYMLPLAHDFPAGRLGPAGAPAMINCGTCHQGAYKPYYGASDLAAYPELQGPAPSSPMLKQANALPPVLPVVPVSLPLGAPR